MPHYIIKLTDEKYKKEYYMEWSTVVDAPASYGMTLSEFKKYYKEQYGLAAGDLSARLKRVKKQGISAMNKCTVDGLISCNRAGKNGDCLSKEQILEKYCR